MNAQEKAKARLEEIITLGEYENVFNKRVASLTHHQQMVMYSIARGEGWAGYVDQIVDVEDGDTFVSYLVGFNYGA